MSDLENCGDGYDKLQDYEYIIVISNLKEIKELNIKFLPNDFKHLAGLDKLDDIPYFKQISSATLLKDVLDKSKVQGLNNLMQTSIKYTVPINDAQNTTIKYYLVDRLNALSELYDYLHNVNNNQKLNIKIFQWLKNAFPSQRPNKSKISADFLLEFQQSNLPKNQNEHLNFFIANNKEDYNGVSIFPSDKSYSNDGHIKLFEYEIISITEKNQGISTVLYQCSPQRLNQINILIDTKNKYMTIKNDLNSLKRLRKKSFQTSKFDDYNKLLNKILSNILDIDKYSTDMIIDFIQRLIDQKADKANEPFISYIDDEIKKAKGVAQQRGINTNIFKAQINPDGSLTVTVPPVSLVVSNLWDNIKNATKSFLADIKKSFVKADTKSSVPRQNAKSKTPRLSSQARQSPSKPKQDKFDKPKKPPPNLDNSDVQQPKYIGRETMLGGAKIIKQKQQSQNKNNDKTNDIPKKKKNTSL